MLKFALYTTMYPAVKEFIAAWLKGIKSQTNSDFDLCIGLDGLTPDSVTEAAGEKVLARYIQAGEDATPAEVRSLALDRIVSDYDAVILVDADDIALPDRVAEARKKLDTADVVCTAMRIVDRRGRDKRVKFNPSPWLKKIHCVNVFGFSNTAYRTHILKAVLPFPRDCILVDWFVAQMADISGARMICDSHVRMLYRQYGNNTAPVLPPFSRQQLLRAAELVVGHSAIVNREINLKLPDRYVQAHRGFKSFLKTINSDVQALTAYIEAINKMPGDHVWWSYLAHPDLENLWKK